MNQRSRSDDVLARMGAANPFPAAELQETIAATELSLAMQRAIAAGESASQRHRRASLGLSLAGLACAAVIAALIVLSGGSVDSVRDGAHPTFAAAAVKVAEANPRLLVTAPGWSIVHARGFEVDSGELIYGDGKHPPFGPGGRQLDLNWYPARLYRDRLREIGHACCHVSAPVTSTLLGQQTTTYAYDGQHPNYATILSPQGHVFIEVTGSFGSRQEYDTLLHSLRPVGVEAWLGAMPPEVLRPAARSVAIARMLRGIPVPPGFDTSTLQSETALTDRFMLAKSVTGAVACDWLQRWLSATRAGDGAAAQEAVDAMDTARHWPALLQMIRERGYRGNALPPHGQGWPSEILTAGREIARGHLKRGPAITTVYVHGRQIKYITPAAAAPANVMGCL